VNRSGDKAQPAKSGTPRTTSANSHSEDMLLQLIARYPRFDAIGKKGVFGLHIEGR